MPLFLEMFKGSMKTFILYKKNDILICGFTVVATNINLTHTHHSPSLSFSSHLLLLLLLPASSSGLLLVFLLLPHCFCVCLCSPGQEPFKRRPFFKHLHAARRWLAAAQFAQSPHEICTGLISTLNSILKNWEMHSIEILRNHNWKNKSDGCGRHLEGKCDGLWLWLNDLFADVHATDDCFSLRSTCFDCFILPHQSALVFLALSEQTLDSVGRSRQESLSSIEEDDYDTLDDIDSDKNIVRTKVRTARCSQWNSDADPVVGLTPVWNRQVALVWPHEMPQTPRFCSSEDDAEW